ncbi:MAG: hypothetical protein ACOYJJ_05255 [Anaerovoracaceae bacterium]|jgi:epoxyqueuosine reductase
MDITEKFKNYMDEKEIDLYGIADVKLLNEKARPGRRPMDLFPSAKAVVIIGVGLLDTFLRGWVKNGRSGKFYSTALLELDRRVLMVRRFLRQNGYHLFGGTSYGGGTFSTGIRFGDVAAACGMGYIGKSNALVTPKYGPRVNLIYLATDAPLEPTGPAELSEPMSGCGNCTACEKVCMSGAILGDGFFHARQCEAMVNAKPNQQYYSEFVSRDCDRCLAVCPQGEYNWKDEPAGPLKWEGKK